MTMDNGGRALAREETCQYQGSRLLFRGPKRTLDGTYVACLGGTETYGKFVALPYPDLLEAAVGVPCVNLGWPNAGIDLLQSDAGLLRMARGARLTVLQVPNAANLTNAYYKVHPRRNDRFLGARPPLAQLYPEIDFTDFTFTRHMLATLKAHSLDRFALVHQELAQVWIAGMRRLIGRIGGPVVLLWLADRAPERLHDAPEMDYEPALVSRGMLEALTDVAAGMVRAPRRVETTPPEPGADGLAERLFWQLEAPEARGLPGPAAHEGIAQALSRLVGPYLEG